MAFGDQIGQNLDQAGRVGMNKERDIASYFANQGNILIPRRKIEQIEIEIETFLQVEILEVKDETTSLDP